MKIALCQILSTADPQENLAIVSTYAREAAANGAELIVFPEATQRAFGTGRMDETAEPLGGPFDQAVTQLAEELQVTIVVGTFRPADVKDGYQRFYNTVLVRGPEARPADAAGSDTGIHYDKIHLYDAFGYQESQTVAPGEQLVTFHQGGITCGLATCYDIRFPEQFKALAQAGAEAIIVPTSWAHGPEKLRMWRTLASARALDATCYILAAGQALPPDADERKGPTGTGHSVAVHPNGAIIAEAGEAPEIIYADIDPAVVATTRKELPVLTGTREL
ncbi:MAG: carbon-nitrogen hydrolase family protein [Corynebacterium sp.]|nr:carbon-nitrogen hydrolase family protein [Corynebacterium sp.]